MLQSVDERWILTHVVDRYRPIIFRTSVSEIVLSSNPGVSIRMTVRRAKVKSFDSVTSLVHEAKPWLVSKSEPLILLMNFTRVSEIRRLENPTRLTVVFPDPVAPITLQ